MTLEEAIKEYQYDIGVWATEENDKVVWFWEISGGYCSVGSHDYFDNPLIAYGSLLEFLKTFKPFEK